MYQGAGQHAALAALAFLRVHHQVTQGRRDLGFTIGAGSDITAGTQE
jgi:hypothetical protein